MYFASSKLKMKLKIKTVLTGCWAVVLLAVGVGAASASEQNGTGGQGAYQAPIAPVTRLQVTGAGDNLTLDVERADVQSTLKAILKQAGKQFAPDASVTGQVTLLLTDQPLDTVLRAICDACYLQYARTPSGIYRFTRDDAAIKRAFSNLRLLNSQLREQLRALGLDVPSDERLPDARTRVAEPPSGGGFGGGLQGPVPSLRRDAAKQDRPTERSLQSGSAGPAGQVSDVTANSVAARASGASSGAKKESLSKFANVHADFIAQGDLSQFLIQDGRANAPNLREYGLFVRQNGFVWFNIPEEKPEPVAAVLQLFSQQANVPILVDQSIPSSLKFRVWGNLSPRQLPEALNVLAPTAHLQWRWIGNTVFVVPAPNFQIYLGEQGPLRSAYPPANGQVDSKDRRGGSE